MAQRISMGLGRLGFNNTIFKRKFRWTFAVERYCVRTGIQSNVPEHYVKLAARPNISIEETEINFLNGVTWIPGKGKWETITVTYYDVATIDNKGLFDWLASVYDFVTEVGVISNQVGYKELALRQGSMPQDYSGTGILTLYDGCGGEIERWFMRQMWPTAINFGDLDYSSSEEVTIELTLRYSQVKYVPICPQFGIDPCCTPCVSGSNASGGGGSNGGVLPNTGSNAG